MTEITVLGIDPGASGACAAIRLLDAGRDSGPQYVKTLAVWDMPTTYRYDGKQRPNVQSIEEILGIIKPDYAIIEHVHARELFDKGSKRWRNPAAEWSLAQGFGMLLSAVMLSVGAERTHLVTPSVWKSRLGLTASKGGSISMASGLGIPGLSSKVTSGSCRHDWAEAVLLVEYFRQFVHGNEGAKLI